MTGLEHLDSAGGKTMTVFGNDQPRRNALAQNGFDGPRHSRTGLPGADHDQTTRNRILFPADPEAAAGRFKGARNTDIGMRRFQRRLPDPLCRGPQFRDGHGSDISIMWARLPSMKNLHAVGYLLAIAGKRRNLDLRRMPHLLVVEEPAFRNFLL